MTAVTRITRREPATGVWVSFYYGFGSAAAALPGYSPPGDETHTIDAATLAHAEAPDSLAVIVTRREQVPRNVIIRAARPLLADILARQGDAAQLEGALWWVGATGQTYFDRCYMRVHNELR